MSTLAVDPVSVTKLNDLDCFHVRKLGSEILVINKGGSLWSFKDSNLGEVLYQSDHPKGVPSLANVPRGGIPKMFPIIGPGDALGMPLHGNLRNEMFSRVKGSADFPGADLVLEYTSQQGGFEKFPFSYRYRTAYTLAHGDGGSLVEQVDQIENFGDQPFEAQLGQHNYLRVSGRGATVHGLGVQDYLNRRTQKMESPSPDGLPFSLSRCEAEVDRLYSFTPGSTLTLKDRAWGRKIEVTAEGFSEVIVWNPADRDLGNLAPVNNKYFICLEPCEATERIIVPANGKITCRQRISVSVIV
jgi:D-hexose-6-phosphate mutarotase